MPDIVDEQHHPPIADSCPEVDGKLNCPPSPDGKMEPLPDDTSKPTSPTVETIPTRNITVTSPKPAANPLQFIKVGPATLYRSAQEQLKKVEEVKKVAPVKDEGADWQNNLDNWKCSRRKRQEHIIERVVEVKKFELEDHDRNRRRSKTFNEMMEERSSRGRKMSLPIYHEDNSDDLSDLGLSTAQKDKDKKEDERSLSPLNESGDSLSNKDMDKKEKAGVEVVDNDYEKAVQNCISYAETIVKSRSSQSSCKTESKPVDQSYQKLSTDFNCVLRGSNPKIEGKLSELRQRRSSSSNDSNVENDEKKTINVPKVDISKRRELFEKISENDATKKPSKVSNGDLSATKSIRERLTSLEKLNDDPKTNSNRTKVESDVSVKERLSAMERISSCNDLSPQKLAPPKPINLVEPSINLGEPSTVEREIYREDKDDDLEEMKQLSILKDKIMECEEEHKKYISSQMSMASNDMYQENLFLSQSELRQSHYRHNSLDSLDVDKFSRLSNEALKRVQSLEDFDYCGKNYPASCVSGDTDKEDSGILTADVSSSVSQADDYNLHLDQDQSINHHHPINHQPINHQPINHQTIDHQPIDHQPINNHHPIIIEEITKQTSRDISAINQNGVGDSMNFSYPQIPDQNFSPLDGSQSHRSDYCDRSDISEPIINNVSDQMYVTSGSKHTNVLYGLKNDQNSETVNLNQSSSVSVDPSSGPSQFVISASNPDVFTSDLKESFDPVVNMFSDIMPNMVLTFDESRTLEPPKEKPPPPPVETKIEKQVPIKSILRRLDSTKRIKKELHQKRSSFLGIDVDSDDAYLQQEDLIKPPPDMSAFLQEERRLEQKMYQQSLLRESDSSQGESRDSGVELDRIHHDDIGWHQRHDSEENLTDSEFLERECLSQTEKPWTQHRRSLQDVSDISPNCVPSKGSLDNLGQVETETRSLQDVSQDLSPYVENKAENFSRFDYCRSMPNLQEEMISSQRYRTPPVPPAKKQSYPSRENADRSSASQQMTKQTLQALSAAPKPRLISSDTWMQAKRKPKQDSFNYQHWLIQEAEHRRLIDKSMRQAYPPAKGTSNYVNPPTSTATQGNLNDQWIQPHWQDKNANNAQWANNYQQCQQWNNDNSQWAPAPQQQAQYHTDCGPVQNGNHWPGGSSSGFVPFSNQTNSPPQNDWNGYHNNQWTAESKNQNQNQWRTGPPQHYQWKNGKNSTVQEKDKPLPVSIIQTLTQRVQNKMSLSNRISDPNRRSSQLRLEAPAGENRDRVPQSINNDNHQEKILSVSGKKKCSHCGEELGRGAAMVIESLRLFYHIDCFKCCVCQVQLGDGLMGTDVRVRNNKLHCHNCYSSEDGVKFSCV